MALGHHRPHRAFIAAYLDDVVIHSATWIDHFFHLREVLKGLWQAGLRANTHKCHLGLIVDYIKKTNIEASMFFFSKVSGILYMYIIIKFGIISTSRRSHFILY